MEHDSSSFYDMDCFINYQPLDNELFRLDIEQLLVTNDCRLTAIDALLMEILFIRIVQFISAGKSNFYFHFCCSRPKLNGQQEFSS